MCDNCTEQIYGLRYKCLDCPDYDLCELCIDEKNTIHPEHKFQEISKPVVFMETDELYGKNFYDLLHHKRIMKRVWRQKVMFAK